MLFWEIVEEVFRWRELEEVFFWAVLVGVREVMLYWEIVKEVLQQSPQILSLVLGFLVEGVLASLNQGLLVRKVEGEIEGEIVVMMRVVLYSLLQEVLPVREGVVRGKEGCSLPIPSAFLVSFPSKLVHRGTVSVHIVCTVSCRNQ